MHCGVACQKLTECKKNEEPSPVVALSHSIHNFLHTCQMFFFSFFFYAFFFLNLSGAEHVCFPIIILLMHCLPIAESVWDGSLNSGLRLVPGESGGGVSIKTVRVSHKALDEHK